MRRTCISACLPLLWLGCASVNPQPDYDRVSQHVGDVTGVAAPASPGDLETAEASLASFDEKGLTADDAVRFALLNNPRIRAAFQRVGMSRADLVQAGLFTNPQFSFAFNYPTGGGTNQFGVNLAQNIADLWMIPARKRAARRDLDRAILDAAREAATLAFDTKGAYYDAVAAQRAMLIAGENLRLLERLHSIAQARLEAGSVGSLDVNLARGVMLRAQIDLRNARLSAATSKRDLAIFLGLSAAVDDLPLTEPLPSPRVESVDSSLLVELARQSRLDLSAAQRNVDAARARVQFEYAKVFQDVGLGFGYEHQAQRALPGRDVLADTARASIANGGLTAPEIESRAQRARERRQVIDAMLGPTLAVTIPLFDQNQAQIARARFALREAVAVLDSLDRTISQEVRNAADRAATAWDVARLYEKEVLPQARTTLDISEAAYRAGSTPILNVIEAQRTLLEVQQAYVAALQAAANALIDLERATARPAGVLLAASSPTTQPAGTSRPEETTP
jgi:cobalt-zinc-cadmium efflux system outer membrane protein